MSDAEKLRDIHEDCLGLLEEAWFYPPDERAENERIVAELLDDPEIFQSLQEIVANKYQALDYRHRGLTAQKHPTVTTEHHIEETAGRHAMIGSMGRGQFVDRMKLLGFQAVNGRGSHIILVHPEAGTHISIAITGKGLGRPLIHRILARAGVEPRQFVEAKSKSK